MLLSEETRQEGAEIIATTRRSRPRNQRLWAQETLSDWLTCYADKLEGGVTEKVSDEGDGLCHVCSSFIGCFGFIALLSLLQHVLSSLSEAFAAQLTLLNAAWGAAAVQVFSSWQHEAAQPRSVLLGNLLGCCAGLVKLLPLGLDLQVALAVAATVAAQELSGSVHPAGAASAVIFVQAQSCSWPAYVCMCGGVSLLLVAVAVLFNNMCMDRLYPQAWWPSDVAGSKPAPASFIVHAPQQWLSTYLQKLRGAGLPGPAPVSYAHTCFSSLAAFVYMLSVASLNDLLGWTSASLIGPAAACVSIFSDWRGASSQPWPCLVGCLLGAASGTFCLMEAGLYQDAGHLQWMSAACAVAFTAAFQELSYAKFPAGGSIALSVIVMPEASRLGWSFVLQPGVLSTCLLVIYGSLLNNLQETRLYPRHWPWQRAPDGPSWPQGHSERDLCRRQSEAENRSFTASKTYVGALMVLSQIVFLVFLLFAEPQWHAVDPKPTFDHFAGIAVLTVVGLGIMRAFVKAYGLGAVGFCLMITCLGIQWSMMLESLLQQRALRISLNSVSSGCFAAATVLVSFGALVGKVSLRQILVVLLIELPCYCWSRAVTLRKNPEVLYDGLEIHLFGALFGYAVARVLGPCEMDWLNESSYGLDLLSLLGTLCFWVCFPSTMALGPAKQRAHVAVVFALLGSTVAAFATDSLCNLGKLDVACIRTAVLAGGIAITALAHLAEPGLALAVGGAGGVVSVLGFRFLSSSKVDTCGVLFAHGAPALLGGILWASSPIFLLGSSAIVEHAVFELSVSVLTAVAAGCCCGSLLRRMRASESQELAFSDEPNWVCAKDIPRGSVYL